MGEKSVGEKFVGENSVDLDEGEKSVSEKFVAGERSMRESCG